LGWAEVEGRLLADGQRGMEGKKKRNWATGGRRRKRARGRREPRERRGDFSFLSFI
jgi:hypothetical protein